MAAADLFESRPRAPVGHSSHTVVALVGLAFEARIASTPHVLVLCGQDGRERFATGHPHIENSCRALVSFGVAGGISPHLKPGDVIVASSILDAQTTHRTDANWSEKLLVSMPDAHYVPILGVDAPVVDPREKKRLADETGAAAVDMESHFVARSAAARGLAFVSIRVIVDPADRSVPPAAIAGMRPDGTTSIAAVIASLANRPSQLLSMARIGMDSYAARTALLRVRKRLGHGFGLIDPDEAPDYGSSARDCSNALLAAVEASSTSVA
jgi:adenosylhomocysteine nucleosidase